MTVPLFITDLFSGQSLDTFGMRPPVFSQSLEPCSKKFSDKWRISRKRIMVLVTKSCSLLVIETKGCNYIIIHKLAPPSEPQSSSSPLLVEKKPKSMSSSDGYQRLQPCVRLKLY